MTTKTLYVFKRADGGTTHSLTEPDVEYTTKVRIIADEGKVVTRNGTDLFTVVDADTAGGFYEIDAPEEEHYE